MQIESNKKIRIDISLYGIFRILAPSGLDITPKGKRARGLLAMVVLSPLGIRHRKWLQKRLWSSRSEEQAKVSLRQELSGLRRHFKKSNIDLIEVDRETVRLAVEKYDIRVDTPSDHLNQQQILEGLDIPEPSFLRWLEEQRAKHSVGGGKLIQTPSRSMPPINAIPSLRVGGFKAIGGNQDTQIFANGLTEELLTVVGRLIGVFTLRHADKPSSIDETGYVLEGAVRIENSILITARLYSIHTQEYLWSERLEYQQRSPFDIQEKISRRLVETVQGSLSNNDWSRIWEYDETVYLAWENYQIGRYFEAQTRRESAETAIDHYLTAQQHDPSFLPAKIAMGFCMIDQYRLCWTDRPAALLKKIESLACSLRRSHKEPYGTALLAYVENAKGNHEVACELMKTSLSRANTESPELIGYYAALVGYAGDLKQEAELYRRALSLTQYPPLWIRTNLALTLVGVDNQESISQCQQVLLLDENNVRAHIFMIAAMVSLGIEKSEISLYSDRLLTIDPGFQSDRWSSIDCFRNVEDYFDIVNLLKKAELP